MCNEDNLWSLLPEPVLFYIFSLLSVPCQAACSLVCTAWNTVFNTSSLWRHNLYRDFQLSPNQHYKDKYKLLYYHTPKFETQTLIDHIDEVWYVCFSHDGSMFVTTCQGGLFIVWSTGTTVSSLRTRDMALSDRGGCKYSEFNHDDSLLLVSGQKLNGTVEVAIFSVHNNFEQVLVKNASEHAFSTWYSSDTFMFTDSYLIDNMTSPISLITLDVNTGVTDERCSIF